MAKWPPSAGAAVPPEGLGRPIKFYTFDCQPGRKGIHYLLAPRKKKSTFAEYKLHFQNKEKCFIANICSQVIWVFFFFFLGGGGLFFSPARKTGTPHKLIRERENSRLPACSPTDTEAETNLSFAD